VEGVLWLPLVALLKLVEWAQWGMSKSLPTSKERRYVMRSAAMQSLTNDILTRHPGATIWGIGDDAHKTHSSDHNEDDTAGSKAAQSDSDSTAEHRAIDVKVNSAFPRSVVRPLIAEILSNQRNKHFSGWAAKDEDGSPWLASVLGGDDMFCNQGDPVGSGKAAVLQVELNILLQFMGESQLLTVDDDYGSKTAAALLHVGCGNAANNGSVYWVGEYTTLQRRLREMEAAQAVKTHLNAVNHGSINLPESIQFTIPAQNITAPLVQED